MDELEKAALDATAKAALAPFTGVISDVIGAAGGDALASYRERKRRERAIQNEKLIEEFQAVLKNRGAEPDPTTPKELVEEIIEAAQDNSIDELRKIYARLVAAIADLKRRPNYRREFVAIAKRLEPLDTLVLPQLQIDSSTNPSRLHWVTSRIGATDDQVLLSFRNLLNLGLTEEPDRLQWTDKPKLTPLGRQFLRTIAD
jgi:hypothetical protein